MVGEGKIQVKVQYRVKSIWKTLQGEGIFAGRPAVFVRMVGCNLWTGYEDTRQRDSIRNGADCPNWCDTDFTKEGSIRYTADELATEVNRIGVGIKFCVITGGEPLLQLDSNLVKALHELGFFIAIETNGTIRIQDACFDDQSGNILQPDWIVCSPKVPEHHLSLEHFDELKLVLPDYHPENYLTFAQKQRQNSVQGSKLPLLWIQPEDGNRLKQATEMAISYALDNPEWRVSVQTHKILNVE